MADETLHGTSPITSPLSRDWLEELSSRQANAWSAGNRLLVEQLVTDVPVADRTSELLLDLIQNEIDYRRDLGETWELNEYQARFPELAEALRIQFLVGQFLNSDRSEVRAGTTEQADRLQVGRFVIQKKLGQGGVGVAYRAWDPSLKRVVALKLLRSGQHATAQELARFRIEAEAIARVSHENIVRVYDVGEVDGEPYIAMEYCSGGNLADRLRQSPLSVREAAEVIYRVASGVAAAHRMQIIHRDLKPGNVFLQPAESSLSDQNANHLQDTDVGTPVRPHPPTVMISNIDLRGGTQIIPKVSDFGLAKLLDMDSGQTRTGTILGTPAYMAPEQTYGSEQLIGPAVDVYAVGAMLYECLANRPPFGGSTIVETLEQVRSREPVPIRKLQPKVPADLETIAHKCLQKEPAKRYATIQMVVDEVGRFLADEPILARPVTRWERGVRWCRRNPGLAALSSLAAVLVACLIVAAVWLKIDRDLVLASEQKTLKAERGRLGNFYQASLGEMRSVRTSGIQGQRETGLQAIRNVLTAFAEEGLSPAQRSELRDEAITSIALPDLKEVGVRPAPVQPPEWLAINNPTENYLDWDADQRQLLVRQLEDGKIQNRIPALIAEKRQTMEFALSASGDYLAEFRRNWDADGNHRLRVWNLRNEKVIVDKTLEFSYSQMEFTATKKLYLRGHVAEAGGDVIRRLDLESGQFESDSPSRYAVYRFAIDPTGRYLAFASRIQPPEIIDAITWQSICTLPAVPDTTSVAWDPVRPKVMIGTEDGRFYEWDIQANAGQFLRDQEREAVAEIQFSADGHSMAASTRGWVTIHARGHEHPTFRVPGKSLGYFGQGRRLATIFEGQLRSYERDSRITSRLMEAEVECAEFSPDGNWLSTSYSGGVSVYDARTLYFRGSLGLDEAGCVAFDPLGKELVTFGIFSFAWRWPLQSQNSERTHFRLGAPSPLKFGPPKALLDQFALEPQHRGRHASWSRDGRWLALADYRHDKIWLTERDAQTGPKEFAEFWQVNRVALSPNGQWLAAASAHLEGGGAVWTVKDRRKVLDLSKARHVVFSPDGRWLAVATVGGLELRRTGEGFPLIHTLERTEPNLVYPTAVAIDPHSRLFAMTAAPTRVRIVDLATGDVLANLSHPDKEIINWLSFSADGSRLAVTRIGKQVIVWDLAHLADQLRELGFNEQRLPQIKTYLPDRNLELEIDRGPLPPPRQWTENWRTLALHEAVQNRFSDAIGDLTRGIQSVGSENPKLRAELLILRGDYHYQNQAPLAAWSDWNEVLALNPNSRTPLIRVCRLALFGPVELRNPDRVTVLLAPLMLELGEAAGDREADEITSLFAYAQIRSGKYQAGLNTLAKYPSPQTDPLPYYFQALAQHHLNAPELARSAFASGVSIQSQPSQDASPTTSAEWERIRSEVALLLK